MFSVTGVKTREILMESEELNHDCPRLNTFYRGTLSFKPLARGPGSEIKEADLLIFPDKNMKIRNRFLGTTRAVFLRHGNEKIKNLDYVSVM